VAVPIRSITINDMVAYTDSLTRLRPSTQGATDCVRQVAAQLCSQDGIHPSQRRRNDPRTRGKDTLNERILTEEQGIAVVILAATNHRDSALVRMLYRSGGRISEVVTATWADVVVKGGPGR
jgi:integrase/recombinase XerD